MSGEAEVAAQATGTGGVLMSPLGMATVAAEVAAGTGHSPVHPRHGLGRHLAGAAGQHGT